MFSMDKVFRKKDAFKYVFFEMTSMYQNHPLFIVLQNAALLFTLTVSITILFELSTSLSHLSLSLSLSLSRGLLIFSKAYYSRIHFQIFSYERITRNLLPKTSHTYNIPYIQSPTFVRSISVEGKQWYGQEYFSLNMSHLTKQMNIQ